MRSWILDNNITRRLLYNRYIDPTSRKGPNFLWHIIKWITYIQSNPESAST
jgi:hypothetical protein